MIIELSDITQPKLLEEYGVAAEQYANVIGCVEKRLYLR